MSINQQTLALSLLGCILLPCISLRAAGQMPTRRAAQAPAMLPPTVASDPQATTAMRSALDRLGGVAAWRQIRSAETHATVSTLDGSKSTELYMLDDWSVAGTRFRRRSPVLTGPPRDHNGAPVVVVHTARGDKAMPEFDQARVLLDHLPGAAIEIMLRRPEYIFRPSIGRLCGKGQQCIDVYRKPPAGPTLKEQEWTISASTGLPETVRYAVQNLANSSAQIWEEIDYQDFQTVDGVVVPSVVDIALPMGLGQKFSFQTPTFNQPFNTAAFDSETIQ